MSKRRGGCFVSTLIALLLCGASVLSPAKRSLWGAEPQELKVNYSAVAGAFAPLWLAQDEGLFAKYGLKVDLKYIGAATEVQALVAQSVHIVNSGTELIDARLGGADVVYIAANIGRFVFSLYSKPEIRSVADLRGKVVGATQPNSSTDFAIRILLQEAGISPGKDTRILYVRGVPEILVSLSQGVIDAGVLSAPVTLKARQAGFKELVNIAERNMPMIQSGVGSTGAFLKSNPEAVRRYFQAFLEGRKIARTDAERTKKVIGKYTRISSPEDLEETYRTFVTAWEKVPYVPAAGVQTLLNFSTHPRARTAKPDEFFDNSFLMELERSGFVERLYQ